MKRRNLCRITSLALAVILAAESSVTAAAQGSSQMMIYESAAEGIMPEGSTSTETGSTPEGSTSTETGSTPEGSTSAETGSTPEGSTSIEEDSAKEPEKEEPESLEEEGSKEDTPETETGTEETQTVPEESLPASKEPETEEILKAKGEQGTADGVEVLAAPVLTEEGIQVETNGTVRFLWHAVEGAEGYYVYRSESSTDMFVKLENPSMEETQGETGVWTFTEKPELGKAYYYKVCAFKTEGEAVIEGAFSEVVNSVIAIDRIEWSDEADKEVTLNLGETKQLTVSYVPENATRKKATWRSSNEKVATVTQEGLVEAVGKGTAVIKANVDGKEITSNITVLKKLETITLNKTEITLRQHSVSVLKAVPYPADADAQITWESTDKSVAEVDNGKILAVGPGTTDIIAKSGKVEARCTVRVTVPVAYITLEQDSIELLKGESAEVAVAVEPVYATEQEIVCEVENDALLTAKAGDGTISITAKNILGKTTVKVTVDGQSSLLTVNVAEEKTDTDDTSELIPVSRVKISTPDNKKHITFRKNDKTEQLLAEVYPAEAGNNKIEWSSSDTKIVTVSESGLLTAVGTGAAQITAKTGNGVFDKISVVVDWSGNVKDITIIGSNAKPKIYCNADELQDNRLKNTYQITMEDATLDYVYRSSNEKAAVVDENGLVTAVEPGTADIVAVHEASGNTDTIRIVVERLVEEITLPKEEITIIKGTELKLTAEVYPAEATQKSYEWYSENSAVANFGNEEGTRNILTARSTGSTKVTVSAEDAGGKTASMVVNVVEKSEGILTNSVALTYGGKKTGTIKSGTQIELLTVIKNKDNVTLSVDEKHIAYKSSNEKAAIVDEKGKVTAIAGGTAKITATVLDGSNKSAAYTVTVEQRPESIVFAREEFKIAPKGSVSLKPTVLPSNTKNKAVSYACSITYIPEGVPQEGAERWVSVDKNGKVKVAATAPEGTRAEIVCTSKAFSAQETAAGKATIGKAVIVVGKTDVTKLTMKKTSLELTGLGAEAVLEYTVKGNPKKLVWTSSNEEVITVDEKGLVTVTGYGTAKITLCADNAMAATTTISAYPVKKGQTVAAASGSYGIQQAKNDGNGFVTLAFINKNSKSKLEPELFTFTSSNPEVVYVDEEGVAYANPKATITKNTTVTITAALKNDPLKRKAATKVTVWAQKQVKDIDFVCTRMGDKQEFTGKTETVFESGNKYKLVAAPYGADHDKIMTGTGLTFRISDASMASIEVDETDKKGHTLIITAKKAGRFKIICTANDDLHTSKEFVFSLYSATPVIKSASLGAVNKKGVLEDISNYTEEAVGNYIFSDDTFVLEGADGTKVTKVTVTAEGALLKGGSWEIDKRYIAVVKRDGNYQIAIEENALKKAGNGTYTVKLEATRTFMDGIEDGAGTLPTETVETTFKIADSTPKTTIGNVTVNSFNKETWTKLKISTKGNVERVSIMEETELSKYYEIARKQDGWYLHIKEDKFNECASKKIKSNFLVELEGYEEAVEVKGVTVTAKSTKPSLKQLIVPDILTENGSAANIAIYDNTAKKNLTDYTVTLKDTKKYKWGFTDRVETSMQVGSSMEVKLTETAAKTKTAAAIKQKVVISKDSFRTPIEMDVTVKTTPIGKNPLVTFEKKAVTLNTTEGASKETSTIGVKVNKTNVSLKEGIWEIVTPNGQTEDWNELFQTQYEDGSLTIGLKEGAVAALAKSKATSYSLKFRNVFAEETYQTVQTAAVTLNISKKAPAVTVKMSGKLDLVNRKGSTLTGTVSVGNLNASIKTIELHNPATDNTFTEKFYCVQNKNKVTIYAKNDAVLTAASYKGEVVVTLENGCRLTKAISFKTMQSVPKLKAIEKQTLYKAAENKTVDFNLNKCMPEGVKIDELVTRVLPVGLGIEYDNGHAFIALADETMKAGTYTIQADVYFKGAQLVKESEKSKPVRIKFSVVVKE